MEGYIKALLQAFPEYDVGDWAHVPVTTRQKIEQWTFRQCKDKPVLISMTSGSSGTPATIFHSAASVQAKIERAQHLFAPLFQDNDHVFYNLLGRFCITKKTAELAFLGLGKLCISFGIPSEKNAKAILHATGMRQPDGLLATTGGLSSLLELKIPITTKYAFVGGSLGTKEFTEWVITSLQCRYINTYACNEFGVIAADIGGDGLVAGSNIFLEVLTEQQEIKEEGVGKLLVTDYTNYAMPFIRYVLGDKVELRKKNGHVCITVLGRNDQFINFDQVLVSLPSLLETVKNLLGHEKFYVAISHEQKTLFDCAKVHIPVGDEQKEGVLRERVHALIGRTPKIIVTEKFFRAQNGKYLQFFDLRKAPAQGAHW
ncbi:hypothetical protein HY639_04170 [Candidatus Woesearchaeota archaeon]|nr:hypothetical protein [Candidatus Woesearchaeota archaeon]